jgi:hypothetical protein
MAKPSRWTVEKRYQIAKEMLSQKEPLSIESVAFVIRPPSCNDNSVRLGGIILDVPAGPRYRGFAKAVLSCANSLIFAGECITKTSSSGKQHLRWFNHR